jgi:hypothetical protein
LLVLSVLGEYGNNAPIFGNGSERRGLHVIPTCRCAETHEGFQIVDIFYCCKDTFNLREGGSVVLQGINRNEELSGAHRSRPVELSPVGAPALLKLCVGDGLAFLFVCFDALKQTPGKDAAFRGPSTMGNRRGGLLPEEFIVNDPLSR